MSKLNKSVNYKTMVRIFWQHKTKPNVKGQGQEKVSISCAVKAVKQANESFPELRHWYE